MPFLPVSTQSGSVGLIQDVDPTVLPSDGWSAGRNIRFKAGKLIKSPGPQQLYTTCPIVPYKMFSVQIPGQILWVACGLTDVYVNDSTGWTKITRQLASYPWAASVSAPVGTKIKDSNGYCQQVSATQAPPVWSHGTFAVGYAIEDSNGDVQKITAITTGTTGSIAPAWNTTEGGTTTDSGVTWTNYGAATGIGTTGPFTAPTFATGLHATTTDWGVTWENMGLANQANPYTGTASNRWNGDFFNGVLVLNNGVDPPQAWVDFTTSTLLQDLQNWPLGNTAQIMRSFKNFLIALGGEIAGQDNPYTDSWSAPADPGEVPPSWDYADPTTQAGNFPLGQTGGQFVDGCVLNDNFLVYKSDSVYAMQFVGGSLVFQEVPIFMDIGLLAQDCVVEVNGQHFVVTPNDVVMHNGNSWTSIIDNLNRIWLFNQMDPSQVQNTFVVKNERMSEIWICFAQLGSAYPNTALIYNYISNTWSVIDIPLATSAVYGIVTPPGAVDTFTGGSSGPFTTDYQSFFDTLTDITNQWVVMCSPHDSNLYQMDQLETNNGTPFLAYAERTGLDFGHPEMTKRISPYYENEQPSEPGIVMVTDVYPKIRSTGPVQIQVGVQARDLTDPVRWTPAYTYNPATQSKFCTLLSGRLVGFRVSSQADVHWELDGYGVNFKNVGYF